jgi:hypothetical protein
MVLVGAAAWTHASTTNQNENLLQTKMVSTAAFPFSMAA